MNNFTCKVCNAKSKKPFSYVEYCNSRPGAYNLICPNECGVMSPDRVPQEHVYRKTLYESFPHISEFTMANSDKTYSKNKAISREHYNKYKGDVKD
jgi:hypothetical protein